MGSEYGTDDGSRESSVTTSGEPPSLPPPPLPPPPRRRSLARPVVATFALIAMNVAVFLYQQSLSGRAQERFIDNWALVPYRFSHPGAIIGFTSPRLLTIITSLFLHSGFAHIALNMFFLYAFGNMLERAIGTARFFVVYFVAGIASSVACIFIYWNQPVPVVGASGAIYGVLAAYLLLLPPGKDRMRTILWMLALLIVPAFLPSSVMGGLTGGAQIAVAGHVGGFIVGGLVMQAFIVRARQRRAALARTMSGGVPPPESERLP